MLQPTDYSNTVKRLDECIELRGGGGYKAVPEKIALLNQMKWEKLENRLNIMIYLIFDVPGVHVNNTNFKK